MRGRKKLGTLGVIAAAIFSIGGCSLLADFDAQKLVKAYLDRSFKGEVKEEAVLLERPEEELLTLYEEDMEDFVTNSLLAGVQADEQLFQEYVGVSKNIFAAVKYEVKEAKKISRTEYEVEVEYEPIDIFHEFDKAVKEESDRLLEKAESGEYQGTEEEINKQLETDFLENNLQSLNTAYENRTYGKKQSILMKVSADEDLVFSVNDADIADFIQKILRFDEIQD